MMNLKTDIYNLKRGVKMLIEERLITDTKFLSLVKNHLNTFKI